MKLSELKDCILKNKLPEDLILIEAKANQFLAKQYLDYIIEHNLERINYINSLYEITDSALSLVINSDEVINILRVDTFKEVLANYNAIKNTIVVCNSIDKSIASAVEGFTIKLPAFEDWQIKDYMHTICSGLDDSDVDWLFNVTSGNIYKIDNELSKIKLFQKEVQTDILTDLHYEVGTDLYKLKSNDIFKGIINNNRALLLDALQHRNCIDLTGFYTITSLLNIAKQLLFLRYNSGLSFEAMGIKNPNAVYYINRDYQNLSEAKLLAIIDFLSYLDQQIKVGELDFSGNDTLLVDYILCKVFAILE